MNRNHWRRLAPALVGMLAIAFLGMGCESSEGEPPDAADALRLEPAEAGLEPGGAPVTLRIVNGRPPYRWEVADETLGALSGLPDANRMLLSTDIDMANYHADEDAEGVNTVTVTDKRGWSASSRMRIIPEADDLQVE